MKVVSIVGARPQFIKAAPVCRALRVRHEEVLVHTGQHYDRAMSGVFFEELGIPEPDFQLDIRSGSHGHQTAEMLSAIEDLLVDQRPEVVLVYGDTNTTLAAALAAAKIGIPVAHVEAGLRSFNRAMPEEVNRVVADHVSDLLLCPTRAAVENLRAEGITDGVELVGDVMLDAARYHAETVPTSSVLERFGLEPGAYYLATVHRAGNSDDPERLGAIVRAFAGLDKPVLWPVHPRTRKNLATLGLDVVVASAPGIMAVDPLPYGETIAALRSAATLLTDSGGMQKEAYFFAVPCVTLREETEWVETVDLGWNTLAGADEERILAAARTVARPADRPDVYGDGHAAEAVVRALEARYSRG